MKKITLFLDKTLRIKLAKDKTWSVAYRAALDFFAKLVAYASDPRIMSPGQPMSVCQEGFNKYVCGCHCESREVRGLFAEAHRIEACLTLRYCGLMLEIKTYRSGDKQPYGKLEFTFSQNGDPAVASASIPSTSAALA